MYKESPFWRFHAVTSDGGWMIKNMDLFYIYNHLFWFQGDEPYRLEHLEAFE
jgi:hypothetical protein